MDAVLCSATNAVRALGSLQLILHTESAAITTAGVDVSFLEVQLAAMLGALDQEFDLPDISRARGSAAGQFFEEELRQELVRVKDQLRYHKKRRVGEQDKLKVETSTKVGSRMRAIWCVRASLSPPHVPVRTMAEFLSQFPNDVCAGGMSHCYVSHCRDAFAELLKEFNSRALHAFASSTAGGRTFVLRHVHDEAQFRLRSFSASPVASSSLPSDNTVGGARFSRSRSSKVQNNDIQISNGEDTLPWWSELQPLAKKDADTLGLAPVQAAEQILSILGEACTRQVRVVHCLTGDGLNTNEAAAKRLLAHFSNGANCAVKYFLIVWRCASHQGNLVVLVAICGGLYANPLEKDELCANCSRFFKYVLPEHCDNFARNLFRHVSERLQVLPTPAGGDALEAPQGPGATASLQRLYGRDVLPDTLADVFRGTLLSWTTYTDPRTDEKTARANAYCILYRWLLKVEEKPVITRFWLFTECVFCFLRMSLLQIPMSLFSVKSGNENEVRMARVAAWFLKPETSKHLRKAALCLRLTQFAVKLSSRKNKPGKRPVLVRLADGEVQQRTGELLQEIL